MRVSSYQDDHFDVVIIGGGPSGTAAGITLLKRDGISVAVVEQSDYTSFRIGESLSPGIRPLLEYLDIWEQFKQEQSLESFGSQAAWGSDSLQGLDYMFTLHGPGWSLDRRRFDRMLAESFRQRGGTLFTKTRFIRCEQISGNDWAVYVKNPDKTFRIIHCQYLMDATGRRGTLAKQLGATRQIHDHLVGVGRVGQLPESTCLESCIQVEACEYGWWYTAPIPGNRVSVVLMSDADIVNRMKAAQSKQWNRLLNGLEMTSNRISGVTFVDTPKVFSS